MRILIAEDDSVLADGLTRSLRQSGYAIDRVKNGPEADTALSTQEFDLLILDLGLPLMSGLEVLRRLRARNSQLPVLILTAADSVEQRVKGLDLGADDYMAKPFALSTNSKRACARSPGAARAAARPSIRHGSLSYDQVGRIAYINEQMIDLSARELGVLEVLLQRTGRLVSKEQLVDHLCEWGEEVSNNAIEVYVHRLRKKIEPSGVRIATVRGLGYCLEKLRDAPAAQPAPTLAERGSPPPTTHTTSSRSMPHARFHEAQHGVPVPPSALPHRGSAADSDARPRRALREPVRAARRTRARSESIQHSLFGEILDWMLAPLLLLWPMSIAITYLVAKSIANGPFDHALEDERTVLAQQVKRGRTASRGARLPGSDARHPARRRRRQRVFPDARPARRTASTATATCRCRTTRTAPQPASSQFRNDVHARQRQCASPIRTSNCAAAGPAPSRGWPWCRWPRRSTSAPSWPTKSSRA